MRHRINKLKQLNTGAKKKNVFVRNLLTSFVKTGRITTTPKRAKVLKAETDAFFSKLVKTYSRYNTEAESKRECIKIVKATILGSWRQKLFEWLPKYLWGDKRTSYVMSYKLGVRK